MYSFQQKLIVKIYINQSQQIQVKISNESQIDSVIHQCITKYKLKKGAHAYLKKQISETLCKLKTNRRCKTQHQCNEKEFQPLLQLNSSTLNKKGNIQNNHAQLINKSKTNLARIPRKMKKCSIQQKVKIEGDKLQSLDFKSKRKVQSQKENINYQISHRNKNQPVACLQKSRILTECLQEIQNVSRIQKLSLVQKTDQDGYNETLCSFQADNLFSPHKITRVVTQSDAQCKMKQLSLKDLQKQLNEQMIDLRIQKKIMRLQPQICNLFRSIIRYNPPKVNKIDPRYASFQDLSEKVIKGLHSFLIKLQQNELYCLDYLNFKKFLVKYRADCLLDNIK